MSHEIRIEFTRFSAFYSPLIAAIAGGFLKKEGLEARHAVSAPGRTAIASLLEGSAHVVQSAPSQGLMALEQGKTPPALHFAQINERDGFFLTGRAPDRAFSWDRLRGKRVLVDHGMQPMAMFKYACFKQGLEFGAITAVDAGSTEQMIAAFRRGEGDFVHLQGPAPQELEHDGAGHIVAALGDAIGPCAFSSLAATREWLATDVAKRFMARLPAGAHLVDRDAGGRGGPRRGVVLPRRAVGGPERHDRHVPAARQLDPARGDHPARLGGDRRHLPPRRAHHPTPPLRGRDRPAPVAGWPFREQVPTERAERSVRASLMPAPCPS